MRLSLLVLTCRRTEELLACLDGLADGGARGCAEVIVGLNGGPDSDARTSAALSARHPWVRSITLGELDRGTARNRLAAEAAGEYFYFLDDDTIPPPGFAGAVIAAFERWPHALAVGGPNVGPPGAAAFPRAVDHLLRSTLGAGPMAIRHLVRGPEEPSAGWVFTLSNFGVRRAAYESRLRFPGGAASGEETLFLHELERQGHVAVHAPSLFVFHRRRGDLLSFLRQTFNCGLGRAQTTRAAPASLYPATLAPALAALTAAALAFTAPAAFRAAAALYFGACALCALRSAWTERDPAALYLAALLPLAHGAYAAGMAAGAVAWPACDAAVEPGLSWRVGQPDG